MKKFYTLNFLIFVLLIGTGNRMLASEYYWVGNSGNWSDLTHWANSSGGAGSAYGVVPTSVDNVHFDANSFTTTLQSATIDPTQVSCLNMDWTGVGNTPTLTFSSSGNILNISGSLTFVPGMSLTNCGPVNFIATTTGQTITSGGNSFGNNVTFDGIGGGWTLQDALSTTYNAYSSIMITLTAGTLNTNNQMVSSGEFISTSGNTRELDMGSSVFNLSWISYPFWNVSSAGMTLNSGTSTINATCDLSGWSPVFIGGGFTYYNLSWTGPDLGGGGGSISDGNTFNDVSFASSGTISSNNTFHNVTFSNNGTIYSSNSYNNLTFSPGFTYMLGSGQTQTINGTLTASGTCSAGINIESSSSSAATISMATGSVVLDYVTLTYIAATGGASFTANDAVDGGNNTGWTAINILPSQNLYWIGGTGNWSDGSHWSTTSGGSAFNCSPGSGDDVFFDVNSFSSPNQTATLDASTANCHNMNWTGVTNVPTLAGSSSTLNIYGSLTLAASGTGMNLTFSGPVNFIATTTGQTITSAGNSFGGNITFNGAGGGWTLQDALSTTYNAYSSIMITLTAGTLNTNNQMVSSGEFISTSGNTRELDMGSSVFNLSWISYPFWNVSSAGMTLNSGTSTINATCDLSGWSPVFIGGGFTYYNLSWTGPDLGGGGGSISDGNTFNDVSFASSGTISSNNTFHNVTFSNNGTIYSSNSYNNLTFSPGFTYMLGSGQTQTINGTLTASGTCSAGINIESSSSSAATISMATGSVVLDYVTLTYIAATGGASFTANDAVDGGNNTGWTAINTLSSQNLYWIGGTGNWTDGNHWSTTSGGSAYNCSPSSVDNVFFDANSFSITGQTVTIDASTASCNNMNWTGVTNSPTFANANTLNIYGSLTLASGMTLNFSGPVNFNATTTGQTITSAGNSFGGNITFNGAGGGWTLQDALSTTYNAYSSIMITLTAGTLNTNNQTVSSGEFISTSGNTRELDMGSSVFNLSWISYPFWNVSAAGMTLNSGTSTINATCDLSGWSPYFIGGGFTYYNLSWTGPDLGSGGGVISDGNTFNDVSFASNGNINSNNTFHNVTFSNNGTITGANSYNNLTFSPAFTYTITNSTTQTIGGALNISGNGSFPVRIESSSPGQPYTFSKASGTVCADYIRISDNTATGGATFNAGTNSQDLGGNTGWNFPGMSTAPSTLNASVNPLCNTGSPSTTLTQTGGSLGALAYWQWYSDAAYTVAVGGQLSSPDASLVVTPNTTTTYYLRAEWPQCVSPLPGPSGGITITVNPLPQGSITANGPFCTSGAGQLTWTATTGSGTYTVIYNDGVADRTMPGVTSGVPFNVFTTPVTANTSYTLVSVADANCSRTTGFTGNSASISVTACSNTWIGNTTQWDLNSNWTVATPTSTTDGIIPSLPSGGNFPIVSIAAAVRNIEVDDRAIITLNNTLNVYGSWTGGNVSNATILGSGTVILSGAVQQSLSGKTQFQILQLNNELGAQMQANSAIDIFVALQLPLGTFDALTYNGQLTLKSTSASATAYIDNFSIVNNTPYSGNVTAERFYPAASAANDFNQHMLGLPVGGNNLSVLGANGSDQFYQAATGGIHNCNELLGAAGTPYGNVFSYVEANASICVQSGWKVKAGLDAVATGVGYSVILSSGGSGTLSVTGAPNLTGSYNLPTTNTGYANTTSDQGNVYPSGVNLLSNPYPASLSVSALAGDNPNFDGAVYVWEESSASYSTLETVIPPFGAFKVIRIAGGAGNYVVNGTSRTTTAGTFQRLANPIELNMTVTNNNTGLTDETTVGFNPDATAGFDQLYDLIKLPGGVNRHTLYTLSNNDWMLSNILNSISETSTVPVGLRSGVSGTYTMNFNGIGSFDPTSYVILEDLQTGVMHDVRSGDYTFTSNTDDNYNRFVLHFTPAASVNTTEATCSNQGMINVVQPGMANWNYTIADNNNTTLSSGSLNVNSPLIVNVPAGVYTLTLKDNNGYTVVKTVEVNGAQPVVASFTASANPVNVDQDITLSSTSSGAVLNSWNFGDGTSENGAMVTHAYAFEGVYNITLNSTSASGCNSTASNTITVTRSATGVNDLTDINNIFIWSNENTVNVDFTQLSEVQANIEIYNILGQKLSEDKYVTGTVYHKEIPNIEEGYILVSVKNNDAIITKKLFISNIK